MFSTTELKIIFGFDFFFSYKKKKSFFFLNISHKLHIEQRVFKMPLDVQINSEEESTSH